MGLAINQHRGNPPSGRCLIEVCCREIDVGVAEILGACRDEGIELSAAWERHTPWSLPSAAGVDDEGGVVAGSSCWTGTRLGKQSRVLGAVVFDQVQVLSDTAAP